VTWAGSRILFAAANPRSHAVLSCLREQGFQVLEAANGIDAISLLRRPGADAALIELDLPEIDGVEFVRRIRRESQVPIMLLVGRAEETACTDGLELGADDFVLAPYSPSEVVLRVKAMTRRARGAQAEKTLLRSGPVELDLLGRRCLVGGQEVSLTRREFDLLCALLQYEGRIHTREQLLALVWGGNSRPVKTVDSHIASLRRKLGSAISIKTLRGVGYRMDPA
jgi:DNA-binding response OmpR family regulator